MKELISAQQAEVLMLALVVILPIVGWAAGRSLKHTKLGVQWGCAAGLTNLVLWHMYGAITDRLGLDTVKNLLVNLVLFAVIGAVIGFFVSPRRRSTGDGRSGSRGRGTGGNEPVLTGGPPSRSPAAAQTFEEVLEPPRDAG